MTHVITVHSYSAASLLFVLRAKDSPQHTTGITTMNFIVYSIQLFFAALLHLSAVKVRAVQCGGFEIVEGLLWTIKLLSFY